MDYTAITAALDFTSVFAAIGSVAAAVIGVMIAVRGYRIVKGVVKS